MKTATIILVALIFLLSVDYAFAWKIQGCYKRTPSIGHDNGRLKFKCKFCDLENNYTWKEYFWDDTVQEKLEHHLLVFHKSENFKNVCR